ncbi:ATP-binding cassette domain-containing protein [Enterococcus sp. CWB-B31]|uniref:ABC transporter ATP-binding protein/permease n=1 Tax=Enterococcus sp. CWB-B31 TaxID=2885159 RepID=UPI001E35C5EB|nr:ABC transporter ATP-binding protein/permease [Enterococcus sp. CWB-B31]MCB5954602.1 ATP-binding cassette domain-containing protein [Enterococcus sp. CWB-B31]
MGLIETKELNKKFVIDGDESEQVLNDISITIKQGSLTAIYGPSGCGKSTLLNIISGLDRQYSGEVLFNQMSLKYMDEVEITNFRQENIGFVFQNFNLIPHLSVIENVMMPMHLNKKKTHENLEYARKLLKDVGLEKYENKNVTKLSGGQKQRVAIARALANDPELVIADEPTGSLDSKSAEIVLDILKKITEKGKTVIVVTHSSEVSNYADSIIKMKDGYVESHSYETTAITTAADNTVKTQQKSRKRSLKRSATLKLAISNFMQRKFRNIMIAFATAIGISGILISLGLGTGIINLIEEDMDSGDVPSQIQISLNKATGATGVLNKDDRKYIEDLIGAEKIKYFESPFSVTMSDITISDLGNLSFMESMPSYAQVVSLYTNTEISVSANSSKEVVSGKLYTDAQEQGLTVTTTLLDDFKKANNVQLDYNKFLGKEIVANINESTSEGNKMGQFKTKIVRIIKDEADDNNSFMSSYELEGIIKENQFTKIVPYMILQPKDKEDTASITEKLNATKKYTALSQSNMLEMVITFIKIIQGLLVVMSFQAIIVSIVMIGVILYINIIERTKEIGVMKAVGYQNKDIKSIFNYEAMIITVAAFVIAVSTSLLIGTVANAVVKEEFPNITQVFQLSGYSVLFSGLLALGIGFISAIIPVLKISKFDPAESLRYE